MLAAEDAAVHDASAGPEPSTGSRSTAPEKLPNLRQGEVQLNTVRSGYRAKVGSSSLRLTLLAVPLAAVILAFLPTVETPQLVHVGQSLYDSLNVTLLASSITILVIVALVWQLKRDRAIYLLDFTTFYGFENWRVTHEEFMRRTRECGFFTPESISFQEKLLARSAIGQKSHFPPGILQKWPPECNYDSAREEAEMVMFACVERVLAQTGFKPRDIDVLIVNCSLFCPTPSLSAMIVNHFSFKPSVLSFNLGGMGCSAGVISVDLAKRLLLQQPGRALIISTENITQNWYQGNERSMMVQNTLFRCGCAGILMSSKSQDRGMAKLKLKHTVRTHMGANTECFKSVYQRQDASGKMGVELSKTIMRIAGDALKANITTLAPLCLPISEQVNFFVNATARKILRGLKVPGAVPGGRAAASALTHAARVLLWLPKADDRSTRARTARTMRSWFSLPVEEATVESDSTAQPAAKGAAAGTTRAAAGPAPVPDEEVRRLTGPPYIPDFHKAFAHFCVHAGGRAVIDAVQVNLQLTDDDMAASRYVLHRYGNTSSSSIWYEMDYHIRQSRVRKGDRIWQIAFGSGFKCNSAVWEALRDFDEQPLVEVE